MGEGGGEGERTGEEERVEGRGEEGSVPAEAARGDGLGFKEGDVTDDIDVKEEERKERE